MLVDLRPVELDRLGVDHLVVAQHGLARLLQRRKVALPHRDQGVHGVEAGQDRPEQLGQRRVDQDNAVFGLVGDIGDLLRERAGC